MLFRNFMVTYQEKVYVVKVCYDPKQPIGKKLIDTIGGVNILTIQSPQNDRLEH